jgi:SAM-dependent methyltransferase
MPPSYAAMLKARFSDFEPEVDDLFLLEAHQVAALPERAPVQPLARVLKDEPRLHRFFVTRHPGVAPFLDEVLAADDGTGEAGRLLWELADWLIYQRAPELYDRGVEGAFSPDALGDGLTLDGKVVIDAGAGTGVVALAAARTARWVFAVEPVAALRRYLRRKAAEEGLGNLFVLEGFVDAIPLPDATADVLLTRNAVGWRIDDELPEIDRVIASDGWAAHFFGGPDLPGEVAEALAAHGYRRRGDAYVWRRAS